MYCPTIACYKGRKGIKFQDALKTYMSEKTKAMLS